MLDMNDLQKGLTIVYNGDVCEVIDFLHARTGMKKPTVWTKLRNYRTGQVLENQFRSNDKIRAPMITINEAAICTLDKISPKIK